MEPKNEKVSSSEDGSYWTDDVEHPGVAQYHNLSEDDDWIRDTSKDDRESRGNDWRKNRNERRGMVIEMRMEWIIYKLTERLRRAKNIRSRLRKLATMTLEEQEDVIEDGAWIVKKQQRYKIGKTRTRNCAICD